MHFCNEFAIVGTPQTQSSVLASCYHARAIRHEGNRHNRTLVPHQAVDQSAAIDVPNNCRVITAARDQPSTVWRKRETKYCSGMALQQIDEIARREVIEADFAATCSAFFVRNPAHCKPAPIGRQRYRIYLTFVTGSYL